MKTTITCPACSASFLVEPKEQACRAKCGKCGGAILVPPASQAPAARPKAAPIGASKPTPKPAAATSPVSPLDALLAMEASVGSQPTPSAAWGSSLQPVRPAPAKTSNTGLLIGVGVGAGAVLLLLVGLVVVLATRGGGEAPKIASTPTTQESSSSMTNASTSTPAKTINNTSTPTETTVASSEPAKATPSIAPIVEPVISTPASSANNSISAETEVVGQKEALKLPELIELVEPGVVRIVGTTNDGEVFGSGFVVDMKGTVVTNHHVVAGTRDVKVSFANGKKSTVLGYLRADATKDIAIIRIDTKDLDLKPVALAKVLPRKGEQVVAFGCPIGLEFTTTDGIISAIRDGKDLDKYGSNLTAKILQTSTPISSGNSGGPLVNTFGEVVGMNTAVLQTGQNLNFSVAITEVRQELEQIKKKTKLIAQMPNAPPKPKQKTDSGAIVKDETPELLLKKPPMPSVVREWKFETGTTKARILEINVADAERRPPTKFTEKDFNAKGRYQPPKRITVIFELPDRTTKKTVDTMLDSDSRKVVQQFWKDHAYYNIKYRIVKKGSDLVEGLAEASSDNDAMSSQINIKNLMLLFILSDITLPPEQSEEVIKLITDVLEKYSTKTGKRQLTTLLNDIRQRAMGAMANENAIADSELVGIFKQTLLGG
jgi:S1-C subfamily serine protease